MSVVDFGFQPGKSFLGRIACRLGRLFCGTKLPAFRCCTPVPPSPVERESLNERGVLARWWGSFSRFDPVQHVELSYTLIEV